jgi:hypothetical protein
MEQIPAANKKIAIIRLIEKEKKHDKRRKEIL